jgi:acetyltransferase-like isoleucine patch superfamily enzyme
MITNQIQNKYNLWKKKKRQRELFRGVQADITDAYFGPTMRLNIDGDGIKVKMGESVHFRGGFLLLRENSELQIGNRCFFNNNSSFQVLKKLVIGNDVMFGDSVMIFDHSHNFKDKNKVFAEQGDTCGDVIIGSNVWIGASVVILKGVTIGNNVVIGANVVVREDIPDNTLVYAKQDIVSKPIF